MFYFCGAFGPCAPLAVVTTFVGGKCTVIAVDKDGYVFAYNNTQFIIQRIAQTGWLLLIHCIFHSFYVTVLYIDAGVVSFLAGNPGTSGSANGAGAAASFTAVNAMTLDSSSYLYVADDNSIRRVSTCKTAATIFTVCLLTYHIT
jgi:hypothetical protein